MHRWLAVLIHVALADLVRRRPNYVWVDAANTAQ